MMMGYGFHGMGMALWMGLGTLLSFLFLVGAIYLGARAVKAVFPDLGAMPQPGNAALDILKARYAKGEISREEYEGVKQDLA